MRSANYVEETTTSIAGTSGDGAITLTAITNTPRFSTVFGTQATTIRYVIEDTVNKKFETGVGSVASNVLTRTRPQVTWDGTTYDDSTPSALQFGATPTSGNIKVRLSATAESQSPNMPGQNATLGSDTWRDYSLTSHMSLVSSGAGAALTAGREYYFYYKLDRSGLLEGIRFETTAALAGTLKLALYAIGQTGLPVSKIVDFNAGSTASIAVVTDTATGTWSPAGPVNLTSGWYCIGFICDVAATIRAMSSYVGQSKGTPLGRSGGYGWSNNLFVAGSHATGMPAVPSLGSATLGAGSDTLGFPFIGLKVTA